MNSDVTSAISMMEQMTANFTAVENNVENNDVDYGLAYGIGETMPGKKQLSEPEQIDNDPEYTTTDNMTNDSKDASANSDYITQSPLIDLETSPTSSTYQHDVLVQPLINNANELSTVIPLNDKFCYNEFQTRYNSLSETGHGFKNVEQSLIETTTSSPQDVQPTDIKVDYGLVDSGNPFNTSIREQLTALPSDPPEQHTGMCATGEIQNELNEEHVYNTVKYGVTESFPVYENPLATHLFTDESYQQDMFHTYNETDKCDCFTTLIEPSVAVDVPVHTDCDNATTDYHIPLVQTSVSCSDDDTSSYNSETPLIKQNPLNESLPVPDEVEVNEQYKTNHPIKSLDDIDTDSLYVTVIEEVSNTSHVINPFQSALSLYTEQQTGTMTPIPVIGGGWEFGSICSINLHADAAARVMAPNPVQGRLLSRIFSKTVGYLEIKSQKSAIKPGLQDVEVIKTPLDLIEEVKVPENGYYVLNLIKLSISMTLLHIAVYGLRNLQSSLNTEAGLGVYSLAAVFAAFMIGSLVSPFLVKRYPPRTCLCLATSGHLPYFLANYYPTFSTMIISSGMMGFSNAVVWNAICTYITEIGIHESALKKKNVGNVLSRFFGIFFLILQFSVVIGNLISSIVLSASFAGKEQIEVLNISTIVFNNDTLPTHHCGLYECNDVVSASNQPEVGNMDKILLLGSYSGCAVIAIFVLFFLLDPLPNFNPQPLRAGVMLRGVGEIIAMIVDKRFIFIVLLCLYTVLSNGFVIADVLKAYITCPLGVQMVGYSMICFGMGGSIGSYIFGKLNKHLGRITVFLAAV